VKFIHLDCGLHSVLDRALSKFRPLMTKGGIAVFDHYSSGSAPSEAAIVEKYFPASSIRRINFAGQPAI
jgi:hypothetical protein